MSDFFMTVEMLKDDTLRSIGFLNKSSTQFWRRIVIKSVFAWFEGQIFLMKKISLIRYEHLEIHFSTAELALLREDKYCLNEKGEVSSSSNNYQKFLPNYQFAFKAFAKAHASQFVFDASKLPQLKQLESVRNRLTHPKANNDLQVTDEEIDLSSNVVQWHVNQSSALFRSYTENPPPQIIKRAVDNVTTQLQATKPVILFWRDGTVFEFPLKKSARQYASTRLPKAQERARH